jgi:hypothetical protein
MTKVRWTMLDEPGAGAFREPDAAPGIIFHYKAAYTTKKEAEKCASKIKAAGMKYRIQERPHWPGKGKSIRVHVVFIGHQKGR